MAAASQGVTRDQLLWTHDAYIRDDSYRAALAVLINAHHRLPFSRVWGDGTKSEEHTSELQSLMRISYAVFCLKKKTDEKNTDISDQNRWKDICTKTTKQHNRLQSHISLHTS